MIDISVGFVGNAVVAYIHQNEKIFSVNGFVEESFAFPTAKTRTFCINKIVVFNQTAGAALEAVENIVLVGAFRASYRPQITL